MQGRAGREGVLAQKVEIKLHGIIDDTGEIADYEVNIGDARSIVGVRRFDGDVDDALSNGEFVHGQFFGKYRSATIGEL